MTRDSEHATETEDEEANPYPLEGKYKDESDRQQYMSTSMIQHPMSEFCVGFFRCQKLSERTYLHND